MEGKEKIPGKSGQAEVPIYQPNLDPKKYVEDPTYRWQMDAFNPWMNYTRYLEKIDELIEIFNDRELGLSRAQADAIKENLLIELADLRPQKYERALHEKTKREVFKDFSSAESHYEKTAAREADASDELGGALGEFGGAAGSQTPEAKQDKNTESLNFRQFATDPDYRLRVRRTSFFRPIAELERAKIISGLIATGKELGLTPAQVERLISTMDEEYREKLTAEAEAAGLFSAARKKAGSASRKKEAAAQEEFKKLKEKYLSGEFKTYKQFTDAVNEMLNKKFKKLGPEKESLIQ